MSRGKGKGEKNFGNLLTFFFSEREGHWPLVMLFIGLPLFVCHEWEIFKRGII